MVVVELPDPGRRAGAFAAQLRVVGLDHDASSPRFAVGQIDGPVVESEVGVPGWDFLWDAFAQMLSGPGRYERWTVDTPSGTWDVDASISQDGVVEIRFPEDQSFVQLRRDPLPPAGGSQTVAPDPSADRIEVARDGEDARLFIEDVRDHPTDIQVGHQSGRALRPVEEDQGAEFVRRGLGRLLGRPGIQGAVILETKAHAWGVQARMDTQGVATIWFDDGSRVRLHPDPVGPARIWRPSRSGPLTDDDLAEAIALLDPLGDWINTLPDGDPRLSRAEVAQSRLRGELSLEGEADRIIIRRTIENLTALMAEDIRNVVAEATEDLASEVAEPIRASVESLVSAAEADDDVAWQPGLDQVDTAFDLLVASLPPSNAPEHRVGRGKALLKVSGKEAAIATLRAGAVEAVKAGWRLALHLITNWM